MRVKALKIEHKLPKYGLYTCHQETWGKIRLNITIENIRLVNLVGMKTKSELLAKIAKDLKFGHHFGNNLDALYDMLFDLPKNQVIEIHCDNILKDQPIEDILEVINDFIDEKKKSSPLFIVITEQP